MANFDPDIFACCDRSRLKNTTKLMERDNGRNVYDESNRIMRDLKRGGHGHPPGEWIIQRCPECGSNKLGFNDHEKTCVECKECYHPCIVFDEDGWQYE